MLSTDDDDGGSTVPSQLSSSEGSLALTPTLNPNPNTNPNP